MNILHAITLSALLHHSPAPVVGCHPGTVSYRFVGTPGATFTYGGTTYSLPASGSIELLSEGDGRGYLAANGRKLPLEVWPIDAFGTRTVPLEARQEANSAGSPSGNQTTVRFQNSSK